tara:strand:+ start:1901 stop:4072 length:2172 start_codon:yes stop_codon:yes gene_type:complete
MVNNPYFYSNQSVASSAQITDSSDNPHTGLIKALSVGLTGSYAIRAENNFVITHPSASTVSVGTGVVFRDGIKQATTTAVTGVTIVSTSPTAGSTYALIVVQANNTVVVRVTNTTNSVPAYILGDIPIALVLYTNNASTTEVQFLTTNKANNGLDLGYADGSSEYVSSGTITGTSAAVILESENDVTVKLGGTAATDVFAVTDSADQVQLSVTGAGAVALASGGTITIGSATIDENELEILDGATLSTTELNILDGVSGVTTAQINNLNDVTGDIQAQISASYSRSGGNITGNVDIETAATSATAGKIALGVDLDTTTAIGNGQTGNNKGIVVDLNATGDVNGNGATVSHAGTVNNTGIEIDVVGSTGGTQKNVGLDIAVSGADTNYAAIFNGGNVGIGNSAPSATLHIQSSSASDPQLLIESSDSGGSAAPDVVFLRDSTSPADGDDLSHLKFMGKNQEANSGPIATFTYADIFTEIQTVLKDSENGKLHIRTAKAGAMDKRISLDASSTTFNEDSKDIDLRVEGNGDQELLVCSASNDNIGIGVTPTAQHTSKLTVEGSIMLRDRGAATADLSEYGQIWTKQAVPNQLYFTNFAGNDIRLDEEVFIISLSDEATNLTAATGKASFHLPFAMTLTGVKATVNTAPTGRTIVVDINEAGNTILTTKLSIDIGEFTSTTAATAAVIGGAGPALANDALLTFDIDHIGSSAAGKGLKVTLYGYRT